ncbi:MAG: hypothetical protein ACTSPW_07280 [Promethearchaeota archaeon]
MNIGLTILLNILPLIIFMIPWLFIRKKTIGKLYFRLIIGIVVFYLIYWILPIIFQLGLEPNELTIDNEQQNTEILGWEYFFIHFCSLIAIFADYPLVTLPFIFFVAPLISIILVWNRVRKEDGSINENLEHLTYEYSQSPYKKIKEELLKNDWAREKEILKLMIVLLPISLYLLHVILDISNLQTVSLTEGKTALGWFIEILFVYLAIFIFSIELLFSSKIALKGRYFGENIREQTFKSLYQVGAPISILSVILFIIQYTESIGIIIYFFAYFIMASIIFILFIDIFEPISILIFIKLLDWWRIKKSNREKKKIDIANILYVMFFSIIAFLIYLFINLGVALLPFFADSNIINSANFSYRNPSLKYSLLMDVMKIITTIASITTIIITAILLTYGLKQIKNITLSFIAFLPILIVLTILLNMAGEYWITGQVSYTKAFGDEVYTLRTALFDANLFIGGNITLLGVLAQPYLYGRYIFNVFFWTLLIYYLKKDFKTKTIPVDDKTMEKVIYSSIDTFLNTQEYLDDSINYLITLNQKADINIIDNQREEIKNLIKLLQEGDKLLKELKPKEESDIKRFYYTLKYLYSNNIIAIWRPEFSFKFEKVEKQGLYVIYSDGRDVFNYIFTEGGGQDPALISGMFSAITSFIQETTKSTQLLRTIDHGDITILIEYGKYVFGALFIKGKQSSEIRAQLKEFIRRFEEKHKEHLIDWSGALNHFKDDDKLVEEIFKEK